jgi:predicted permease
MHVLQDLRLAVRTIRKAPLFASVAVLSLALGIGANTAIFTLIDQLLLQLLPVREPQELVLLTGRGTHYGNNTGSNSLSYPMYQDLRERNQVFSGMFCKFNMNFSLSFEGRTELIAGELVSGDYFPVLGVGAAIGRVFTADDNLRQGEHPVAVLSHGFWQSRFNGDPGVLGKRIQVNGYPFTIVGVSAAGFDGVEMGSSPQLRIPLTMEALIFPQWKPLDDRRTRFVQTFGRLKPGTSVDAAKAGLQPLFHQIIGMEVQEKAFARASAETKERFLKMWLDVTPASKGRSSLRRQFSSPLLALMAIVGLVLLIACTNVANLMIARATARQREIAIRLAMGASRRRLIGQLLQESLLLSAAGGLAGLGLAVLMDKALIGLLPADVLPLTLSSRPDTRVLLFTLAVSALTGLIFGLVPALQATRPNLAGTLKDQAGSLAGGTSVGLRKALVVAQVALSLLLLIGAGLFVQSLQNLRGVDPGFRTGGLVTFGVDPSLNGYKPDRSREYYRQLHDRLTGLPGATSAALALITLLDGNEWDSSVTVEGYTGKEGAQPHMQFVSPRFFETLGIPILHGRDFDRRDEHGAPQVAIVNQKFARRYFGTDNPVGRRIGMGGDPGTKTDIEVIAVVADTKYEDLRAEIPVQVYRPFRQLDFVINMTAYVRAAGDPGSLFPAVRQVAREVDSNVPVYGMRTLEQQVDRSLVTERMLAMLSAAFGLLATALAAVGLYGVMAYMVARRTREIGIRMALGAAQGNVVWLVMREVLLLSCIGIAIGAPGAWLLSRYVETQLFGVKPADPLTIAAAILGIAAVAILSGYLPARRATSIDPIRALRWE